MQPTQRTLPGRTSASSRLQAGFTMIEIGVVLTIVGILMAVGAPSFKTFVDTMDAKSAAMDLVGDLMVARSEALKRNTSMTVAPISGAWTNGWQLTRTDQPTVILRSRTALRRGLSVTAPAGDIVFNSNGRLNNTDLTTSNVSWAIASSTAGVTSRCVVITPTGSARAKQGACA
jgi:type IV fimbrial biogenesis protein FimT